MNKEDFSYDPYAFSILESLDLDEYIVASYILETSADRDVIKLAEALAAEATTGTWIRVPTETEEVRKKYQAKVVGVYEIPIIDDKKRAFIVIAHPTINFNTPISIPMILSGVAGNLFSTKPASIKLVDIMFPKLIAKEFKGPKFGIDGLRKLLNVYDRPFVAAILKPKVGMSPKQIGDLVYELSAGGADLIKDDEMQSNPSYCPRMDRLSAVLEALDKAKSETGKKCLFALNITDKVDKMLEIADEAVSAGANCLLINYITAGFDVLRMIAENENINVPILAHPTMARAFVRPDYIGITYPVIKKFVRLCGADITILSSAYGKMYQPIREYFWSIHTLRDPLYGLKSTLPALSGGVYPGLATQHVKDAGIDIMMIAGGGVLGHPSGARAGIKAMLQASVAAAKGIPLEEAAKEHEELRLAIKKWGIFRRPEEHLFKPK